VQLLQQTINVFTVTSLALVVIGSVEGITLNEDQMKIVDYVTTTKEHLVAPLVVYGAFGTGKTESLAQAAILLASTSDDVKLLICTQTNS